MNELSIFIDESGGFGCGLIGGCIVKAAIGIYPRRIHLFLGL